MCDSDSPQPMSSMEFWDYTMELECMEGNDDLHLAAELGKTLLERNKELENNIRQQQNVIEDQVQEIEYLTKQTAALREVNDSRLKIYEQLEVNIQDLERANHRLAVETTTDKKNIKTLKTNIENLELKCEHLQSTIEELNLELALARRRSAKTSTPVKDNASPGDGGDNFCEEVSSSLDETHAYNLKSYLGENQEKFLQEQEVSETSKLEEITQLTNQLKEAHVQSTRDQKKIAELEEQVEVMQEQGKYLERQLDQYHMKEEDLKSVHDELNSLEEVRKGQLCSRCLRTINGDDNISMSACDEDDSSMFEMLTRGIHHQDQLRSSFAMEVQDYGNISSASRHDDSLYKDLAEKYEALVEVNRKTVRHKKPENFLSLQEELEMSGSVPQMTNNKDTDEESGHGDSLKTETTQTKERRKPKPRTPTDFSEAETSSSGFSENICNKSTQTNDLLLFIIPNEKDQAGVYANVIESRFKNHPEYRKVFEEIIVAIKNKDTEPEKKVPEKQDDKAEVEYKNDGSIDNYTDDTRSILSSALSVSSSIPPLEINNKHNAMDVKLRGGVEEKLEVKIENNQSQIILKPLVRQPKEDPLENVMKKRSSSRRKKQQNKPEPLVTHILGSPKVTYANKAVATTRRKKENKPDENVTWNGSTLQFWSNKRNGASSPTPSQCSDTPVRYDNGYQYKPSLASQELHKLKKLELSYADVLRKSNKLWPEPGRQNRRNSQR